MNIDRIKIEYDIKKRLAIESMRNKYTEKFNNALEKKIERIIKRYNRLCETKIKNLKKKEQCKKKGNEYKPKKKAKTKAQLWEMYLREVQLKVKLLESDINWIGKCFTCDKVQHWSELEWWHYISRKKKTTSDRLENIHSQCSWCNKFSSWNVIEYRERLLKKYWPVMVELLESNSKQQFTYPGSWEIEEMIVWTIQDNLELLSNKQDEISKSYLVNYKKRHKII